MSLIWLILLVGLIVWGIMWMRYDRPAVTLWQTRWAYRWMTFILLVVIIGVMWKAESWHTELVQVIAGCR